MTWTRVNRTVALFLFGLVFAKALAGGKDVGNGGDEYALQFISVAKKVADYVEKEKIPEINPADLRNAIERTQVESTAVDLSLNGIPKDALNFPGENRILFNRLRWDQMYDAAKRAALVLHEYLGIMGIDDESYRLSSQILQNFDRSSGFQDADYIVEIGVLKIDGPAAIDLYEDMEIEPQVLEGDSRLELREKSDGGIRCVAEFIRGLDENGPGLGPWEISEASCTLKIDPKIIGPRYY